jgi:hypothetical protein
LRRIDNHTDHHITCRTEVSDAFAGVAAIFGKFVGDLLA